MALLFSVTLTAQTPCDSPYNAVVTSLTTTGATITWTAPNPAPYNGYQYYTTTNINLNPYPGTPNGSTSTNSVTLANSASNTTIYMWIRSRCLPASNSTWHGPIQFTTLSSGAGCPNAPYGLSPAQTYTPQYTQVQETINSSAFAGQYSNVNVIANRQYVFSTSVPTDYVTITDASLSNILAHGPAPLTYNSGTAQVIRYYISTNASCGTQQTARSRYITARLIPSNCQLPQNLSTSAISSTGAVINWTLPSGGNQCHYYVNTSGTPPTANTAPSGNSQTSNRAVLTMLTPNTTYYYWVRSHCNPELSNWVPGGSFTTTVANTTGCDYALYGENPTTPYTPGCFGNTEIISTNVLAGEYSLVNVLPNKVYTFTSSVATDFITISDGTTPHIYASGTTPLIWSSGANTAQIRYLVHTTSTCGYHNSIRTKSIRCVDASACAAPSALNVVSVTNSSAVFNWTAASPTPNNGYQYYYTTTNVMPDSGTSPSGNNASTSLNLNGLNANTTYYLWIRANCGTSRSNWVFGNSFTTVGAPSTGCVSAPNGLHPSTTFVPACFGVTENIVTDALTGQYSNITITSGRQYTFASSLSSDYITIANADASQIYAAGNTPLVWNSGTISETIRFYLHGNVACASFSGIRVKTIACQQPAICNSPSSLTATPSANSAVLSWTVTSTAPSGGYQYYYSTAAAGPNDNTAPSGNSSATTATLNGLTANTVYYIWVRSNCETSQSAWVSGGSFTTLGNSFCNTALYGLHPSSPYTPFYTGSDEPIVMDAFAGEYSDITIVANKQYTFSSSATTDFITLTNTNGTVLLANGTSPLVWNSASNSGVIRYYLHTNAGCGNQNINRTRFIMSPPVNNCNAPANLATSYITSDSCLITYTASSNTGATYDVYFSTVSTTPLAGTVPLGNIAQSQVFLYNLSSGTTYYYWIRSKCGSSAGAWVSGGSFTTNAYLSCNGAAYGLYPTDTFTPSCSGNTENIVTDAYAGEFSNIAVIPNRQYVFTSSTPTDFISITNQLGSVLLASGFSPLSWSSGSNSGIVRYFTHGNNSCASQNQNRTRAVSCSVPLDVADTNFNKVKMYPNPTQGILHITGQEEFQKIEISNSLGQRVRTALMNSNQLQMDISDLAAGMYLVRLFSGQQSDIYKVIKE